MNATLKYVWFFFLIARFGVNAMLNGDLYNIISTSLGSIVFRSLAVGMLHLNILFF